MAVNEFALFSRKKRLRRLFIFQNNCFLYYCAKLNAFSRRFRCRYHRRCCGGGGGREDDTGKFPVNKINKNNILALLRFMGDLSSFLACAFLAAPDTSPSSPPARPSGSGSLPCLRLPLFSVQQNRSKVSDFFRLVPHVISPYLVWLRHFCRWGGGRGRLNSSGHFRLFPPAPSPPFSLGGGKGLQQGLEMQIYLLVTTT